MSDEPESQEANEEGAVNPGGGEPSPPEYQESVDGVGDKANGAFNGTWNGGAYPLQPQMYMPNGSGEQNFMPPGYIASTSATAGPYPYVAYYNGQPTDQQPPVTIHQPVIGPRPITIPGLDGDDLEPEDDGPPDDYLSYSIFVTLCCCWPVGIVAIIRSVQCRSAILEGDLDKAKVKSNEARSKANISLGIGLAIIIVGIISLIVWYFTSATLTFRGGRF